MRQGACRFPLAPLVLLVLLAPAAVASHDHGSGTRSLGGATVPDDGPVLARWEAEAFAEKPEGSLVDDAGATGGKAWKMTRYGLISQPVDVPETGVVWLRVRARGEHPPGLMTTHMHPVIDGQQRGEWDVGPEWRVYKQSIPMPAGRHVLSVDNFNNYHAPADDRTLVVDWVEVVTPTLQGAPRVGQSAEAVVDGPDVHMAGTGMAQRSDPGARDGTSWHMWGIGCFVEAVVFDHPGAYRLQSWLRGNDRKGEGSHTTVLLDGKQVDEFFSGDAWQMRETTLQAKGGASVLEICYDNDYGGELKRNLWLDEMRIQRVGDAPAQATPPTPAPGTPTPASPAPSTPAPSTPAPSTPSPSTPAPSTPGPATPPPTAPQESVGPTPTPASGEGGGSARTPGPAAALATLAVAAAALLARRRR